MKAQIQKPAPLFVADALVNGEFKSISLENLLKARKYIVLIFYPQDFTFVCPTEIIAFSDRSQEFEAIGCTLLGFSVDSVFTHLAWCNTPRNQGGLGKINFPLCSDLTKSIAHDYGILIEDGPNAGVSLRGLFIIDEKGILRQITVNDLPVGRSVDEVLRLIKAFQFTDQHGEVCPANWKPGSKTMKADPIGAKSYFAEQNATHPVTRP
jgi:alkyl hydroperoxide reductase subunit AhpC